MRLKCIAICSDVSAPAHHKEPVHDFSSVQRVCSSVTFLILLMDNPNYGAAISILYYHDISIGDIVALSEQWKPENYTMLS